MHVRADDVPWTLDCAVLKAVAGLVNENPFGAVGRAYLTIHCRMIGHKELLGRVPPDISRSRFLGPALRGVIVHWDTWEKYVGHSVPRSAEECVSLICTSRRPNTKGRFGGNLVAGLMVYPAANNGEYYRIGMWEQDCDIDPAESCLTSDGDWPTQITTLI